ncbi:cyclic nucleotide-binding protein [Rhodobacter xanthinilyticus]|uniref:Cyclic nucleotide-binding protein n=1 Tax=Rhodobacter xanthinilyticus TaxID=1850250 RepID=A0A1D9MDS4_9RHOB|nr:Crp/Fnr family transcriptional regulator [Rhodobacter xanthinilyticus]AOZ69928.1 cyclic nucleotide-binding protein [Rhodobacter xanthinilyticus]
MNFDSENITRKSLLLASVPRAAQDKILATAREREMERGATIFLQGERASSVYIVVEGWVKLYRIAPSGAEAVVGVFTRGHSFGEAVAFTHDTYPVSAECATDCRLVRVDTEAILRLIREEPGLSLALLAATFAHLHRLVAQIEQLKAQTGAQRVAEFLLELAPCGEGRCEVTLPYDKVLIAGRLGMKPESLSRAFAKLRDYGVTVKQNLAEIEEIAVLRDYAEEDPAAAWAKG